MIPAEKYPFVNCILTQFRHCNSPFFSAAHFSPFLQFILVLKYPQKLMQTENELEMKRRLDLPGQ